MSPPPTEAYCDECDRPMLSQGAFDRVPKAERERAGLTRTGAHGMCQSYYRRDRYGPKSRVQKGLLDASTLATLRRAVGLPPEGPTPALKQSWREEDRTSL